MTFRKKNIIRKYLSIIIYLFNEFVQSYNKLFEILDIISYQKKNDIHSEEMKQIIMHMLNR